MTEARPQIVLDAGFVAIPTRGLPWHQQWWRVLSVKRRFVLRRDHEIGGAMRVVLPAGYESDGLSIPRAARALLDPVGVSLLPGIAHDHALEHGYVPTPSGEPLLMPEHIDAHRLFRTLCREINDMPSYATVLYVAVRTWFALWPPARRKYRRLRAVS